MNHSLSSYLALIYLRCRGEQAIRDYDRLALLNTIFDSWILTVRQHRSLKKS